MTTVEESRARRQWWDQRFARMWATAFVLKPEHTRAIMAVPPTRLLSERADGEEGA